MSHFLANLEAHDLLAFQPGEHTTNYRRVELGQCIGFQVVHDCVNLFGVKVDDVVPTNCVGNVDQVFWIQVPDFVIIERVEGAQGEVLEVPGSPSKSKASRTCPSPSPNRSACPSSESRSSVA